ncbi:DUF1700 domain-containing protein [Bacillus sp. DNRA2]|uniref:DUF1700 domain-containing protein n=1 Tax=Bacillus sp. DNRA2 TaxID=2723053 RepID=UPI00145C6276|nr:DUF1700 domain-containing protein [Bacillus sp. DNRA2]NMD71475.1 DUF1700 domain-containing protein [Bacillus sp. DNRA2]
MNKQQFLAKLSSGLKHLPAAERQDILQDFEEHFSIGKESGKSEEQILATLGSPQQIAKDMLATYHLEKVENTATTGNIFRAVWAVIGLGFFNLVIVLAPFIALVALVFAGWVAGLAMVVSPILFIISVIQSPETFALFTLFLSLALCGIGLFIVMGMLLATRSLTNGFIRYLRFNVKLVQGGLKHD